jgi:hypothetical protein
MVDEDFNGNEPVVGRKRVVSIFWRLSLSTCHTETEGQLPIASNGTVAGRGELRPDGSWITSHMEG